MESKNSSLKKIYPSVKTMLTLIISAYLIILICCIAISLVSNYITSQMIGFKPLDYIIYGILTFVTIIFILITRFRIYIIINTNNFVNQKYFKSVTYDYNKIIFIDDIRSRKDKKVYIYFNNGNELVLTSDARNTLLREIMERCPNLMSRLDFVKKFPNKDLSSHNIKKKKGTHI